MSVTIIPNQPISFEAVGNCPSNFDTVYQLFKPCDKIQFQVKFEEPCDDAVNLIKNGGFFECNTDYWALNGCWECVEVPGRSGVCWVKDGEKVCTPASLSQIINPLSGTHAYKVEFQIYNYVSGSLDFNIGLYTYLTVTADGVYTVYMNQTGGSALNFNFMPSEDWEGCIDNVKMIQLDYDGLAVGIMYEDGTSGGILTTENNPEYFQWTENYLTFTYNLTCEFDGCFKVCIYGGCNCKIAPFQIDLEDPTAVWTETGGGTADFQYLPTEGYLLFDSKTQGQGKSIQSPNYLCVNWQYYVEFEIGDVTDAFVNFQNGSNISPNYSTAGTHSFSFTAQNPYFNFNAIATQANGTLIIVKISIYPLNILVPDAFDYCSQPFQVFNADDFCTNVVTGCNDSDAFGFKFIGSGFQPSVRLQSKLMPNTYTTSGGFEVNSLGERSAKYAEVRTVRNFRIIDTPIYLWDFLSRWIYYDHPKIEGEEFAYEEDNFPDVSYNKFMTRGSASLPMGKKKQNMFKTNCSNGSNNC